VEEEQRVNEQRRSLRAAMEELANLELTMSQVKSNKYLPTKLPLSLICSKMNKQMHEERQQAISEMSHLSHAKQSVQQHMLMLSEAQKRMERNNASSQPKQPSSDAIFNMTRNATQLRKAPPIPFLQSPTNIDNIPYTASSSGRENMFIKPSNRGIRQEERVERNVFMGDMASSQQKKNYFTVGQVQSNEESVSGDIELSEIQREVELLRKQSNDILQSTVRLTGT